jgi:hypothetical protein
MCLSFEIRQFLALNFEFQLRVLQQVLRKSPHAEQRLQQRVSEFLKDPERDGNREGAVSNHVALQKSRHSAVERAAGPVRAA